MVLRRSRNATTTFRPNSVRGHMGTPFRPIKEYGMQRIGFVILLNFKMLYFAALSVFEFANISAGKQLYGIELLSEHGGMVRSSLGT